MSLTPQPGPAPVEPINSSGQIQTGRGQWRPATREELDALLGRNPSAPMPWWYQQGYAAPVGNMDGSRDFAAGRTPVQLAEQGRENERNEQHRLLRTWFSQQRQRQQGNQAERGSAGGAGGTGVSSRPQMAPGGILGGTSLLGG